MSNVSLSNKEYLFIPLSILALVIGAAFDNQIVGLAITLGFGLFALWNTKAALAFLFLYFPVRNFLIEFNPALKGIGDIIILFSLLKVFYWYRKDWKSLFKFEWFEYAYFGFLAIGAVVAFFNDVSITAIIFQIRAFVLFYLLYYIVKRIKVSQEDIKRAAWLVLITSIAIVIQGLVEKLSLRTLFLPQSWVDLGLSPKNAGRIYGLVGNPNMLAVYLSFSYLAIVHLKDQILGSRYMKIFLNITLVAIMGVWFLTYSRGTYIALGVAMVVYLIMTRNWQRFVHWAVVLVAGIVLIGLPTNMITAYVEGSNFGTEQKQKRQIEGSNESLGDRLRGTFDEEELESSRALGRLYIVNKGFDIYQDHPIVGTGFATFGDSATLSYGSPIYEDYEIERRFYSDNQYIQIIVQTGAIGVLLFAVYLLHMLYRTAKEHKNNSHFSSVMVSVLLGAFAAGMVYNIWEMDVFTLFFFPMLAFLLHARTLHSLKTEGY
ncbi:O-antigen ligase family protein [Halobacillus salinus]|uniref:O-antigen ligase family protein n=1 Tax=Halobacillus salinus TaxID=192814 RepID=A0A4Z0GVE4_9BACI|nr:O-antigen ligase family protein [Halobacillus salinus]TGB01693.1 O-antigen ligase family protein [Halobacillus salinus]